MPPLNANTTRIITLMKIVRTLLAGSAKILTMIVTGMFAAACLILTAVVCRVAFRLGNRPMRRAWVQRLRLRVAWVFNFAIWAASWWVVVAYGRCMGRAQTETILVSSLVGFSVSWFMMEPNPTLTLTVTLTLTLTLTLTRFMMEPLWILLIAIAPCLCDTNFMNTLNDRANDIGLDLSMLIG